MWRTRDFLTAGPCPLRRPRQKNAFTVGNGHHRGPTLGTCQEPDGRPPRGYLASRSARGRQQGPLHLVHGEGPCPFLPAETCLTGSGATLATATMPTAMIRRHDQEQGRRPRTVARDPGLVTRLKLPRPRPDRAAIGVLARKTGCRAVARSGCPIGLVGDVAGTAPQGSSVHKRVDVLCKTAPDLCALCGNAGDFAAWTCPEWAVCLGQRHERLCTQGKSELSTCHAAIRRKQAEH